MTTAVRLPLDDAQLRELERRGRAEPEALQADLQVLASERPAEFLVLLALVLEPDAPPSDPSAPGAAAARRARGRAAR